MEGRRFRIKCASYYSSEKAGLRMDKSVSRWLYIFGFIIMLIGGGFLVYAFSSGPFPAQNTVITTQVNHPFWAMIGSIIALVGYLLGLVAWIGAVARTAQLSRWIWFVCLIILPFLGMLCYIFFGPRSPSRRARQAVSAPPPTPSYGY